MALYAIYDEDSFLYVTSNILTPELDNLGKHTLLFTSPKEAWRRIRSKERGLDYTKLQTELAFWLLEKVYNTPRWDLNVSHDEWMDAVSQFQNLTVHKICMLDVADVKEEE